MVQVLLEHMDRPDATLHKLVTKHPDNAVAGGLTRLMGTTLGLNCAFMMLLKCMAVINILK